MLGSSTNSTQYPGRNCVSPMTANECGILASRVGLVPAVADPMRSKFQASVSVDLCRAALLRGSP